MDTKPIFNLNDYFNAPSIRNDAWGRLRYGAQRLNWRADGASDLEKYRKEVKELLEKLSPIEVYMGYPGKPAFTRICDLFRNENFALFAASVTETADLLESGEYRTRIAAEALKTADPQARCFDLLVVKKCSPAKKLDIRKDLFRWRSANDKYVYNVVVVDCFEDALLAIMYNANIQACVIYDDIGLESQSPLPRVEIARGKARACQYVGGGAAPVLLGNKIRELRPEINLFHSTEVSPEKIAADIREPFERIFYSHESIAELHLSILKAVGERCETPFFDAVKRYSREPVGTFHALPIARGNSVFKSPWMKDFYGFYGEDIFLAESSATTGGLDSLLQPKGTLKAAQEKASRCFGSKSTFFVTSGTSTSNKIVHQALTKPGDIVLLDRACHESHHFAFLLTGALPYYLEGYTLDKYSIAGGVRLETIKKALVDLQNRGMLDRVKMVILTNCTFDGITYNVQQYMEEILAIKPDMVFLWDEAWFAFAHAVPHYRQRTAMRAAGVLSRRYGSAAYRERYEKHAKTFLKKHPKPDAAWVREELLPDPDRAKVRVYATQSTHKTLSCFRQGSMIHIHDALFSAAASDQFRVAYVTHTTTSPNYQILASLDVARRQVAMEGYELVQRQIEMALLIRRVINSDPLLNRYFRALGPAEMIPDQFRKSGVRSGYRGKEDWDAVARAWESDDFVLDPCRINVCTSKTGISGFTIRTEYLAKLHNIQVNKTGLNSFCLMTNVGTTRSAVAYLIGCLKEIAADCAKRDGEFSRDQREQFFAQRVSVTRPPALPAFPGFHGRYQGGFNALGRMREALFDAYHKDRVDHYCIDELAALIAKGARPVGATFVVPVPPGFPLVVPGQLIDAATLTFLKTLNPAEILGLDQDMRVCVFKEEFLKSQSIQGMEEAA